jgi:hypothetical protein
MRARRGRVLAALAALSAGACGGSGSGSGGTPQEHAPATSTSAAVAAPSVARAQQAAWEEQARAELAADVLKRSEAARQAYGEKVPLRVEADLFVLVGAERGVPFDAAAELTQRALDVYLGSFFARRPDRAVTLYVVKSASAFAHLCDWRFASGCERGLGAYSRKTRDIIVNVGPGLPTITHELVHPLVQTDFPRAPAWFEEGIASLFETPVFEPPGEIHGAKNWRTDRLVAALASPAKRGRLHVQALFGLKDGDLDGEDQDALYAAARAFCRWLDERGRLWPFYRAWRDGVATDPNGEKSFAQVTGMAPEQADAVWLEWAGRMR